MPKKLVQMPIEFSVFDTAVKSKNSSARTENQQLAKDPANIFAAWTTNNVKVEIKLVRGECFYVAGFGLNDEKLATLKDEIIAKGMHLSSEKKGYIYIGIRENLLEGFGTLYDIINDIDAITQRRAYARLGIEFKPNEAYLFIAETLQNAIKRGQPWAISRGYGGFDALDKFCVVGYSIEGREQERNGKNAYREHMIPCDMMNREGIRMFGAGATVEEVAAMFERNNKILLISDSEQETLDYKMGLQCVMPEGWKFGDDVFARIRSACIIMEENVI
jgi:hypothetical protein